MLAFILTGGTVVAQHHSDRFSPGLPAFTITPPTLQTFHQLLSSSSSHRYLRNKSDDLSPPAHPYNPQWLPLPLKYAVLDLTGLLRAGLYQLLPSSVSVYFIFDDVFTTTAAVTVTVRPGEEPGAGCI